MLTLCLQKEGVKLLHLIKVHHFVLALTCGLRHDENPTSNAVIGIATIDFLAVSMEICKMMQYLQLICEMHFLMSRGQIDLFAIPGYIGHVNW